MGTRNTSTTTAVDHTIRIDLQEVIDRLVADAGVAYTSVDVFRVEKAGVTPIDLKAKLDEGGFDLEIVVSDDSSVSDPEVTF